VVMLRIMTRSPGARREQVHWSVTSTAVGAREPRG
jgi:hypothetical protein